MIYTATITSVSTFAMTCWGGNAPKRDKNRLEKNIQKAGGVVGRRQESIDTAFHPLVTNKLRTIWADETHPLRLELITDTQTEAIGLGILVVGQLDAFSRSFQRPFEHTVYKRADKRNTHRQERWGCGDDEAGVKWTNVWE